MSGMRLVLLLQTTSADKCLSLGITGPVQLDKGSNPWEILGLCSQPG